MASIPQIEPRLKVMALNIENKVCLGCHLFSLDILSNAIIEDITNITANQLVEPYRLTCYQLKKDEIAVYPQKHHHNLGYKISVMVRHKCNSDKCYHFERVIENILYEV